MSREGRYDVEYHGDGVRIVPHFCRQWDEDGGCYGTNPDHGMSMDEAREECARWHEQQASMYRDGTHYDVTYYTGAD